MYLPVETVSNPLATQLYLAFFPYTVSPIKYFIHYVVSHFSKLHLFLPERIMISVSLFLMLPPTRPFRRQDVQLTDIGYQTKWRLTCFPGTYKHIIHHTREPKQG
jgi:hypothetical protein